MDDLEQLFADMEALLERIISQQRDKVMAVALDILPHLQPEEIQDPQDYPEVAADTMFNYEDGLLAGLLSARAVLRSNIIEVYRARAAHRWPVKPHAPSPQVGSACVLPPWYNTKLCRYRRREHSSSS